MDWIPALLKHLSIARSAIAALFITSFVLYAGPRVAPDYIEPLQKEWIPALVAILVFSASLLLFWGIAWAWTLVRDLSSKWAKFFVSSKLDDLEINILLSLGKNPSNPLDLDRINYGELQISRLELEETVHNLEQKGLVSLNPFGPNLVSLTREGRQRTLKIQNETNEN